MMRRLLLATTIFVLVGCANLTPPPSGPRSTGGEFGLSLGPLPISYSMRLTPDDATRIAREGLAAIGGGDQVVYTTSGMGSPGGGQSYKPVWVVVMEGADPASGYRGAWIDDATGAVINTFTRDQPQPSR